MGKLLAIVLISLSCPLLCGAVQRQLTQTAATGPSITQDLLDVLGRNTSIGAIRSAWLRNSSRLIPPSGFDTGLELARNSVSLIAGPKLTKTVEAAVYTTLAYANDTSTIPLGEHLAGSLLTVYATASQHALPHRGHLGI